MVCLAGRAEAQTLPSVVDPTRLEPQNNALQLEHKLAPTWEATNLNAPLNIPESAKGLNFELKSITFRGLTAFSKETLSPLYKEDLGKEIQLAKAWDYAASLTRLYRERGYFLSQATVPTQKIEKGELTIDITEGYIAEVHLEGPLAQDRIVLAHIEDLKKKKPLKAKEMESFLLRLNDLPGTTFRAVLSADKERHDGGVILNLIPAPKAARLRLTTDNFASRYNGPQEAKATYEVSLSPMQRTLFTVVSPTSFNRMRSGTVQHSFAAFEDVTLGVEGGWTVSSPGYKLKAYEIESESKSLGFYGAYQWLRQRDQNLSIKGGLKGSLSQTDILGYTYSKDRTRSAYMSATYDFLDSFGGSSALTVKATQEIPGLGASEKGDPEMSRLKADPSSSKIEFLALREQELLPDWTAAFAGSGQKSNGYLFSSEEMGYGGQDFGQAYDGSEFMGDDALMGRIELRHAIRPNVPNLESLTLQPYVYWDGAVLWQRQATGGMTRTNASSTGGGIRFNYAPYLDGLMGLAFPLSPAAATPPYGGKGWSPRFFFQITMSY